jgi:hypothetical protein
MKVYLAWDEGDYYGPDALPDFVHSTFEGAARACASRAGRELTWSPKGRFGDYRCLDRDYRVEEVEVLSS